MDTCCCKDKIYKLEETVESLKLHFQEKESNLQLWKNVVQNLLLKKFGIDIERELALSGTEHNEAKTQSGRLGCKSNLVEKRSVVLSSSNPASSVVKFVKVKEGLIISEDVNGGNAITIASKTLKEKRVSEGDKATGEPSKRGGNDHSGNSSENKRRKEVLVKETPNGKAPSGILKGCVGLNIDIQNTDNDVEVVEIMSKDRDHAIAEMTFEEFNTYFEVSPETTNQKTPTDVFDNMDSGFEHFMLSSLNNTNNEDTNATASLSIPSVIVSNAVDPSDADVIVLTSSSALEGGATKISQYELPNNKGSDFGNTVSLLPQETEIGVNSVNANSQSSLPSTLRRRKSNYRSPSKSANSKTADVDLDDDATWRKWTPDLDEAFVDQCSSDDTQNKIASYKSVPDNKRNHLGNFSVLHSESVGDLNYSRIESLWDTNEKTSLTVSSSKYQGSSMQMGTQGIINAIEISETASSVRAQIDDNDDLENTNGRGQSDTVEVETIDLDSDSSDDTRELFTSNALKDHLDTNEMLNTEDSSDMSQDIPSVESVDHIEDSEEAKKLMFSSEDFVNRALRTHNFRNKLLSSAIKTWQSAKPPNKEAVDVKNKAAKKVIVMDDEKKIYKCSQCEASLTNSYDRALKHAQGHFVKRSYQCGICQYKSSSRTTFVDHYKNPQYLECFKLLADHIYDKNDFVTKSKSSLHPKRSKTKSVDLKALKNCTKLKCKTVVKIVRCSQTDKFVLQYDSLMTRLRAISSEMPQEIS